MASPSVAFTVVGAVIQCQMHNARHNAALTFVRLFQSIDFKHMYSMYVHTKCIYAKYISERIVV